MMSDVQGVHSQDQDLFAPSWWPRLRRATGELSWLLTRGYSERAALKLVGDRYGLTARQRAAVCRCACSDAQRARRAAGRLDPARLGERTLLVDGLNQIIILESALRGGVLLLGRDGCLRDLASVHGRYRAAAQTDRAIALMGEALALLGAKVRIYLDAPVSNSGRLRARMLDAARAADWSWEVELHRNPDRVLAEGTGVVISSDGWILDTCRQGWLDLLAMILHKIPDARVIPLDESP